MFTEDVARRAGEVDPDAVVPALILLIDKTGANQTQKAGETLLAHLKELGVKEK